MKKIYLHKETINTATLFDNHDEMLHYLNSTSNEEIEVFEVVLNKKKKYKVEKTSKLKEVK